MVVKSEKLVKVSVGRFEFELSGLVVRQLGRIDKIAAIILLREMTAMMWGEGAKKLGLMESKLVVEHLREWGGRVR